MQLIKYLKVNANFFFTITLQYKLFENKTNFKVSEIHLLFNITEMYKSYRKGPLYKIHVILEYHCNCLVFVSCDMVFNSV